MLSRARALATCLIATACSGQTAEVKPAKPSVEVVAVPLTNASVQQLAYQQDTDLTPPWSLTASDGTGLQLTRVDAKAVFEGPLAFTELHLYFHNPEARRREGTFSITLPTGAAVSRFAMETDGNLVEAEVVDKATARRAYDDFLHRRQDPALLEKGAGNQFTAKVFPIPASADKHIVISFSQQLAGAPYVLPLRGLPQTERVDVALSVLGTDGARTEQTLHQTAWKPDRDFVSSASASAAAVGDGTLVAAQVGFDAQSNDQAMTPTPPAAVTVLVDTSASRAAGYARYVKTVRRFVAALAAKYGAALPVDVVAFDQDTQPIYSGTASGYGDAADAALVDRGAAGASDLEQALAALPKPAGTAMRRVVVITDGVMTAGADAGELAKAAAKLDRVDRIDVALAGGIRDDAMPNALTRAQLPHAGAVLDLDADGPDATAAALAEPVLLDVAVDVPGADWVYPRVLPTVRVGHRAMVYARFAKPVQSIAVRVGGATHEMGIAAVAPALVDRAVAGAEIDELEARLQAATGKDRGELAKQIAAKSVAARVVSSQTSMLVLETDADYARYGIDRKALADILVVGAHGVEQTHRTVAIAAIATSDPDASKDVAKAPRKRAPMMHAPEPASPQQQGQAPVVREQAFEHEELRQLAVDGKEANIPADVGGAPGAVADETGVEGGVDGDVVTGALAGEVARNGGGGTVATSTSTTTPAAAPPPPPPAPRPMIAPSPAAPTRVHLDVQRTEDDDRNGAVAVAAPPGPDGGVWPPANKPDALHGPLADVEAALTKGDVDGALHQARAWHDKDPGDVLALIALGDSLEAKHATATAARVYGSIIDLFPARADLRRFAGERLERLGAASNWLAVDTYRRAVADRPDHLTGHRLLAYALLRDGKPAEAFAAILVGIDQPYPPGRYAGGDRVLREDAGMIGAAYLKASPKAKAEIVAELDKRGATLPTSPSTRFILYWETDANDVDFHIQDAKQNHAFYGHPHLLSGGDLYADITTGYGPECFAIQGKPSAGPYRLSIDYFSQGPMGYGMGLLEVQRYDGQGGLSFEDRPYVIMADHAFVDLGTFK
jgi:hypothetical protein